MKGNNENETPKLRILREQAKALKETRNDAIKAIVAQYREDYAPIREAIKNAMVKTPLSREERALLKRADEGTLERIKALIRGN